MKKHVGRPTNEEVKRRKIKKAITVILPVAVIAVAGIAIASSGSLSKLMGNSVTEYYCEDSSYTLEGTECTKLIKEKANVVGDVNKDGKVDFEDITAFNKLTSTDNQLENMDQLTADINLDGEINEIDLQLLQTYLSGNDGSSTVAAGYEYIGVKKVCAKDYTLNGEYCEKKDIKKALVKTIDNPVQVTITDDQNGNTNITSGNKVTLDVKFSVNHASKKYYYMLKRYESDKQIAQSDCLEVKEGTIKQDLNLSLGKEVKGIYTIYSNSSCNVVVDRFETKAYKLTTNTNTTTNNQANNKPTSTNNTFKIKYNANGGTGAMKEQKVTYDTKTPTTKNAFAKQGYSFNGWRMYSESKKQWICYLNSEKTSKDYTTEDNCKKYGYVVYKNGVGVSRTAKPGETVIFYAQWKKDTPKNETPKNETPKNETQTDNKIKDTSNKKQNKTEKKKKYASIENVDVSLSQDRSQWILNISANKNDSKIKGYCVSVYSKGKDCKNIKTSSTINLTAGSSSDMKSVCYSNWGKDLPIYVTVVSEISGKTSYDTVTKKIHCNASDEYSASVSYTCPSGWTKVGDGPSSTCQKLSGYKYSCESGYTKVGDGPTAYCQKETGKSYSCPSGYTKVGDGPTAYCQKQSGYKYSCEKGWTIVGGGESAYCQKASGYKYTCPSGYTKVGDGPTAYCQKDTGYKYTCPSGYTKVGGGSSAYCQKASGYKYTCPSGYTKVGGGSSTYCQKQTGYKYTCPSGYTKVGDGPTATCTKGKGKKLESIKANKKKVYATKSATKKTNYVTKSTTKTKNYATKKIIKKTNYATKGTTKTKNYITKKIVVKPSYAKKAIIKSKKYATKSATIKYVCGDGFESYGSGSTTYCKKKNA